ncbi:hypothetical protein OSB04_005069 [Centaurea solstitialis]|uniref:Uncharacterized protein n=1 Tax=Centaurea solstitialis TaxID=347529 RepID=A0AA38WR82_9ASTR|nr:hypothetical protein OSB04_005069 [Centaurea solstitialis]
MLEIDPPVIDPTNVPLAELLSRTATEQNLTGSERGREMVDLRMVMEQYNELLCILGQFTQNNMKINECITLLSMIDKLPTSWRKFKHNLETSKGGFISRNNNGGNKGSNNPALTKEGQILSSLHNSMNYNDDRAWLVDSGATSHMRRDGRWFEKLTPINDGSIMKMRDESTSQVCGVRTINLSFTYGKSINLSNVFFVPRIHKILVSGGCLNCADRFILSQVGAFIGFGYFSNEMFHLNVITSLFVIMIIASSKIGDSLLWHARLGYVNFRKMHEMSNDGSILLSGISAEMYKTCMLTKITKQHFPNVNRKSKVLELIHRDLCDFHETPFLDNKKFTITFIDDSSRFCYMYLLHSKDEA